MLFGTIGDHSFLNPINHLLVDMIHIRVYICTARPFWQLNCNCSSFHASGCLSYHDNLTDLVIFVIYCAESIIKTILCNKDIDLAIKL